MTRRPALYRAICWRTGLIEIALGSEAPDGAIVLVTYLDRRAAAVGQRVLETCARKAWNDAGYLVPGVPEAHDDDEACDAVIAWTEWVYPSLCRRVPLSRFLPGRRVQSPVIEGVYA